MTGEIVSFDFEHLPVRVVLIDGDPWFVAKDVCDALDIGNSRQALSYLDDDETNTVTINDGTPGNPNMAAINQPGLYSLVLRSRKPEAKLFKRWVTHEVLPSIRKTGMYALAPVNETREERWARVVLEAREVLGLPKSDNAAIPVRTQIQDADREEPAP